MNDLPTRAAVRHQGRASRQGIGGRERVEATRSLVGHLQSLDALQVGSVGSFVAHDGEPDLQSLIDWLWNRGATVALPVLEDDPADYSMRFVPWQPGDGLGRGRYDIPVPPAAPAIWPDTLLVSFTGFDATGNRIGRGAGFFDRYLADYTGNVIGVGFEAQRFDDVPVEPHDQPMPVVATELGVRYVQ